MLNKCWSNWAHYALFLALTSSLLGKQKAQQAASLERMAEETEHRGATALVWLYKDLPSLSAHRKAGGKVTNTFCSFLKSFQILT